MGRLFVENKTLYDEKQLVGVAKRQNNAKRPFLIVNRMQGKHTPINPLEALAYFSQLGRLAAESCERGERVLVVGFAETATAIGAAVALEVAGSVYCHTTREYMGGRIPSVEFLEEHSHATDHALHVKELDGFDRIIFVDDEITTGRTIVNFIRAIRSQGLAKPAVRFTVAALIFGADANISQDGERISFAYLTRIDSSKITAPDVPPVPARVSDANAPDAERIQVTGLPDPRECVISENYRTACERFAAEAVGRLCLDGENILVLGTEEFMYPSMCLGRALRSRGKRAWCHATTRSPIEASDVEDYPIKSQWALPSLYDPLRQTYVYNLLGYDSVVIATDAPRNDVAERRILGALGALGNSRIHIVRWMA
ncbi:MAG: phosphoribosyltransferase family protein [Synergistaceae bacterium]|jgi:adenine/guanine phosphoribosyltransferase-like PRPP-binding protein|nr:phosphoribosyltransferase family protein [Synergistaceae bacterium]